MRNTIALMVFCALCIAGPLFSRPPDTCPAPDPDQDFFTLKFDDTSLRQVLMQLQQVSGVDLIFRDADVDRIRGSWSFEDRSLSQILQGLLLNTGLSFRRVNPRQMVIFRGEEQAINVKGYVLDRQNSEPLPLANVSLPESAIGTTTNPDGYFVLVDVKEPGNKVLQVDYLGYFPETIELQPGHPDTALVVRLQPHALRGEEITVTGGGRELLEIEDIPAEIRVSTEALSVLPTAGDEDVFRSLQLLPGINNIGDISSGLYIRGGTPEQNLIILDGITVYHLDHFFGFFSAFNPQAIKNIRVLKGGFPARYGGRTSGVVELYGKSGDPGRIHAGIGANLMTGNAYVSIPLHGRGALYLAARRSYSDIVRSPVYNNIINTLFRQDPDDSRRPLEIDPLPRVRQIITDPEFSFYDLNAKLTLLPTGNDVVSLSFYRSRDHLTDILVEPANDGSDTLRNQIDSDWGNRGASAKWSRHWSDRFYSNFLASWSEYQGINNSADTYFFSDRFTEDVRIDQGNMVTSLSAILNNEWQLNQKNKLEFGGKISTARVTNQFFINDTLSIVDQLFRASEAAIYLQNTWSPLPRLQMTGGLRSVYYRPNRTFYGEPRLSFNYRLNQFLQIKGAWGHYHQFVKQILNEDAVVGIDTYTFLSSERLKPDFALHYIAGVSLDAGNWQLDIEGYYKRLSNLNEFTLNYRSETGTDVNNLLLNGTGQARGIEFLIRTNRGRFSGWASYALSKTTQQFAGKNNSLAFPAGQDQRHEVKMVGNVSLGPVIFSADWVFTSGRPFSAPASRFAIQLVDGTTLIYLDTPEVNGRRLQEYHRLDLAATYIGDVAGFKYHFGLSVFNAYNRNNVWYRRYLAEATPVLVRDITLLGITPSLILKVDLK